MKMLFIRLGIVLFVSLNVFCFVWISMPPSPVKTTLGAVSEQTSDFSYRRIVLSNCILGTRKGRFIHFPTATDRRHDVILILKEPDSTPVDCTVFAGYCYGVQTESIDGLDVQPPFIVIDYATPVR
jgi:hypothetical protein